MKQHLKIVETSKQNVFKEEINKLTEEGYIIKSTNISDRDVGEHDQWSIYQAILVKEGEMFNIGEEYCIERYISGELKSCYCVVKEYDNKNGLLKIEHGGKEEIININSPSFVSMELQQLKEHVKINFNLSGMSNLK